MSRPINLEWVGAGVEFPSVPPLQLRFQRSYSKYRNDLECSIIIPQYGKAELTWQCLESLADYVIPQHRVEVIVVDDASPDNAIDKIQEFTRFPIRIVKNFRNRGFTHSCNHGAALATSPVIVFLNNDTITFSDWLGPMLSALEDPQRGIIGAQLIYPDGRIQHAGVWFFQGVDGPMTALEVGGMGIPEVGFTDLEGSRVVPAVTGACLMMRRRDFLDVGGFDERYVNDLEDIDLCLSVAQMGKVCWYEAKAKLIHNHSQTRGLSQDRYRRMLGEFYKKWCGNDYIKLALPPAHNRWRTLAQDFVVIGRDNRWEVWQIIQSILLLWQKGDRIILLDYGSVDGTREMMENLARHNSDRVYFISIGLHTNLSQILQDGLLKHPWQQMQAIWLPGTEVAPYRWEMSLKELGKSSNGGRIVFRPYTPADSPELVLQLSEWTYQPLISLVMPVYNPERTLLQKAIESIQAQQYQHWELCICDDGSDDPSVMELLIRYADTDRRIKVRRLESNQGIASATNAAITMAIGEYIGLLDQDDELTPDALWRVIDTLQQKRADVIYSNEDKIELDGRLTEPLFKPQWSPHTFVSWNYISHFIVVKKSIGDRVGWFRSNVDGSQDYDLILRISEMTENIVHVPRVLYHWRKSPGSVASDPAAKSWAYSASLRALNDALKRRQWDGRMINTEMPGYYRRVSSSKNSHVMMTLIVTVRSKLTQLKRCLTSIRRFSSPRSYDLIFVLSPSAPLDTREYVQSSGYVTIDAGSDTSLADAYWLAVERFQNGLVVFLHDDSEIANLEWMNDMALWALTPGVGPVGCRVLDSNGRIAEAGLYLDPDTVVKPFYFGFTREQAGYFGALRVVRNVSAVSDICLMVRRELFRELGGFSTEMMGLHAVDFCLRAHMKGYRTIITPWSEVYHHGSGSMHENDSVKNNVISKMQHQWISVLRHDPYLYPVADESAIIAPEPVTSVDTVTE